MNENTSRLRGPLHVDSLDGQEIRMVGGEQPGRIERRTNRPAEVAYRSDAIREIAANLERLCIEYACHSRVNGTGNETRAVWAQFKAQIEALKAAA